MLQVSCWKSSIESDYGVLVEGKEGKDEQCQICRNQNVGIQRGRKINPRKIKDVYNKGKEAKGREIRLCVCSSIQFLRVVIRRSEQERESSMCRKPSGVCHGSA